MVFYNYIPKLPLAAFVNQFWLCEGDTPPHQKERILPDGSIELLINLRQDRLNIYNRDNPEQCQIFRGALIAGVHSEYFVIDTASQEFIMGVHFKPGGAFPFFGLPSCELRDVHVSLDNLWKATAQEVREQLLEAETPQARFGILEKALLAQATKPLTRHPAVTFALGEFHKMPSKCTVSEVSEQIGLSSRRFIQVFSEQVGLTPKLFWRIRRFQQVLHLIRGSSQPLSLDWADIALNCGYFDQAHFIHDFQAFAGLNPTTYLAQQSEHFNHVPLPD